MKKALFVIGILILLIGISFARPADARDTIGKIGSDSRQEDILAKYNSTYNSIHDALGENTDIVSYGVAMIGILMIISGLSPKKKEEGKLLYQNEKRQNILPSILEKRLKKNTEDNKKGEDENNNNSIFQELPLLEEDKKQGNKMQQTGNGNNLQPMNSNQTNDLQNNNDMQNNIDQSPPVLKQKEKTLVCPNCGENFTISGNANQVFCPSCGTGYNISVDENNSGTQL